MKRIFFFCLKLVLLFSANSNLQAFERLGNTENLIHNVVFLSHEQQNEVLSFDIELLEIEDHDFSSSSKEKHTIHRPFLTSSIFSVCHSFPKFFKKIQSTRYFFQFSPTSFIVFRVLRL